MGDHHDDDHDGVADQVATCCGENRSDPDSWDDPDIIAEPWQAPVDVEAEG